MHRTAGELLGWRHEGVRSRPDRARVYLVAHRLGTLIAAQVAAFIDGELAGASALDPSEDRVHTVLPFFHRRGHTSKRLAWVPAGGMQERSGSVGSRRSKGDSWP